MDETKSEVLRFVRENDVKFIRLAFCDLFGCQKNISIMPGELARAFQQGVSFDASAVHGFMNVEASDLLLLPDPATLAVLPWRPSQGRVIRFFCDVQYPDGRPFEGDGRYLLQQAVKRAKRSGLTCKIGTECEFYLFEADEKGKPSRIPHDQAGYLDIAPLDKGENIRRQICLSLEEMGIQPESSHHESGPGQNEIDFRYSDALEAADNLVTFQWAVKAISSVNGLFASFLPKPLPGQPGSGLHINLSLFQNNKNLFRTSEGHSQICESFIAGILKRTVEMTAFLNPLVNSYARFGEYEAPKFVTWSHQNRSQLIRIPAATGEKSRMELRSPDPCLNPYLSFALLIEAGLDGVEQNLTLCPPCNLNLFSAPENETDVYQTLPGSLLDAVNIARKSQFIKRILPEKTASFFLDAKETEWKTYLQSEDKNAALVNLYFLRH